MNKYGCLIVSCLVATLATVSKAEPTNIYRLTAAQGSFQQVTLTLDLYRFSQDPNLRDLQVVDAEQHPLPYRIVPAAPDLQTSQDIPLAFFPVAADEPPDRLRQIYAHIKLDGADVELKTSDTPNRSPAGFYLIDVSKLERALTGLRLNWQPTTENQYLETELEASRDLQQWTVLAKGTLLHLGSQGLIRNNLPINLQPGAYEFLRLKILGGGERLHITSFIGTPASEQTPTKEEHWSVAAISKGLETSIDKSGGTRKVAAWEFSRDEVTPASAARILLGDSTYTDDYRLYSRSDERQNWQLRSAGIWYNLRVGSSWETSDSIPLTTNSQQRWRLELNAQSTGLSPRLEFYWQPRILQFIANDRPPFYLAINTDSDPQSRPQVFSKILAGRSPTWTTVELQDLHQQPVKPSGNKLNWRLWIFWGALLLVVLLLVGLALRLIRQLNTELVKSPDQKAE